MTDQIHADYIRDILEIAQERMRSGALDRRTFLQGAAMMGLIPVVSGLGGSAAAASGELAVVNWGGVASKTYKDAYGPGCEKATGLKLVIDGTGASPAKIRAMVDAGQVVWDVCDFAPSIGIQLGGKYLSEIDYSVVDKNKILPGCTWQYSCAAYTFSFIIAYNKELLPQVPTTWKDFWDLKRFPGKRTMFKSPLGQMEAALLASGVAPDKLYPLNVDLALGKIKEIKSEIVWWETGAQSQQYFRDREVSMGNIWHSRATIIRDEAKGAIDLTFNQGIFVVGGWCIPKGNPAGVANANKFIAAAQDPKAQLHVFMNMFNGGANPATSALIPPDMKRLNPSDPDNMKLQTMADPMYWGENINRIQDLWLDAIS